MLEMDVAPKSAGRGSYRQCLSFCHVFPIFCTAILYQLFIGPDESQSRWNVSMTTFINLLLQTTLTSFSHSGKLCRTPKKARSYKIGTKHQAAPELTTNQRMNAPTASSQVQVFLLLLTDLGSFQHIYRQAYFGVIYRFILPVILLKIMLKSLRQFITT